MKRRLRKKLFLGEFQELLVSAKIQIDVSQMDDALFDRWIEEVESNNMMCAGGEGSNGSWDFLIDCNSTIDDSRRKRERIERWLREQPSVKEFALSPVYADLTRAFRSSPNAANRQQKTNRQRGIESEIWRD